MHRYGSSNGNGAGWPILFADSAGKSHILFVNARNSSLVIVSSLVRSLEKEPFENTRMYSWTSRNVGFVADCQLPQAVEVPELADLFQIISPRIKKPSSDIS